MILRGVEVRGRRVDVRLAGGRVAEIGERLDGPTLLDGRGGALLPGLVDHHIHLHALAARERSVRCGPPAVTDTAELAAALAAAPGDEHGWVRGVETDETVVGDLDAAALDRLHALRPVRLGHRSGALWVLNSRAAAAVDLEHADHPGVERDATGRATGRLWRADRWLRDRLPPAAPPDVTALGRHLALLGITALTDATPDLGDDALTSLASLPQHVHALGVGLGATAPPGVTIGPLKIVVSDHALPGLDDLAARIHTVHETGRAVAVHCVTREALVLVLAALRVSGRHPDDRIEHAALVPEDLLTALRGLAVVTQPGFLTGRGDTYRRELPPGEHGDLYRVASLARAGVAVALSSDAPYGPVDPWRVLRAAVERWPPDGEVLGAGERVDADRALTMVLAPPGDPGGPPRRIHTGVAADLILLDVPWAQARHDLDAGHVHATLIGGEVIT